MDSVNPYALVFLVVALVYLGIMGWRTGRGIYLAQRSQNWPTAIAVITQSEVERRVSHSGKGRQRESYHPRLRYEFRTPAGELYPGNTVRYIENLPGSGESDASAYCLQHPVGSSHPVAYDPAKPSRNVLEPGGNIASALALYLLAFAFSTFILALVLRAAIGGG
jgi:hypothetical protein